MFISKKPNGYPFACVTFAEAVACDTNAKLRRLIRKAMKLMGVQVRQWCLIEVDPHSMPNSIEEVSRG